MAGRGRGRRGANHNLIKGLAKDLNTTTNKLLTTDVSYEPKPAYPKFSLPRPTHLTRDEVNMVKHYKTLRTKIQEETPFYITVRKRAAEDEEDDGFGTSLYAFSDKKGSRGIAININLSRVIVRLCMVYRLVWKPFL